MISHAITIQIDLRQAVDNHGTKYTTAETRYRWRCACSPTRGCGWKHSLNNVRWGANRHLRLSGVAAPQPAIEEHW